MKSIGGRKYLFTTFRRYSPSLFLSARSISNPLTSASLGRKRQEITWTTLFVPIHYISQKHVTLQHTLKILFTYKIWACIRDLYSCHEAVLCPQPNCRLHYAVYSIYPKDDRWQTNTGLLFRKLYQILYFWFFIHRASLKFIPWILNLYNQ